MVKQHFFAYSLVVLPQPNKATGSQSHVVGIWLNSSPAFVPVGIGRYAQCKRIKNGILELGLVREGKLVSVLASTVQTDDWKIGRNVLATVKWRGTREGKAGSSNDCTNGAMSLTASLSSLRLLVSALIL